MRSFFENAYRTIFVAAPNQKLVERQIAGRIENGFVLNNPANIDGFGILPYPETDVFKMGCVARLEVFHKAHDVFFEVLSGDAWRERNWELNMYGSGDDEQYLKDLAVFYGIQDKIRFAGQISDVRKVWAENHLAVLTSYSEGSPLSIIEAMLCGRTAVVTNVGGMSELVTDSQNGFKADCTSVSSISQALEKAWNNRHRLKEMGEKAYHEATVAYDLQPGTTLLKLLEVACETKK
jgi:glycosyltransferase involved in cell wall biosynthesis